MQGIAPNRTSTIDVPVRILVPSESVGAIIGKGGQTIRQLTQQTRAKVDVYRGDPMAPATALQEKVITIRGQPDNCINACREILKVMKADADNKGKPSDIPLKVLAHNDYIGRIIGKQGNIINSIKKDTETTVTVSSISDISMNVERVITVKGELESMIKALEIIHQKIKSAFENDTKTYGAQAIMMGGIPPIPMAPPTFAFNPQATRFTAQSQNQAPAYPGFYPSIFPSVYNPQNILPPQAAHQQAQQQQQHSQQQQQQQHSQQQQHQQNQQQQQQPQQQVQNDFLPESETVFLYIPNVAVGAIIGTKGSFIKNIIKLSGASVKITPLSPEESKNATERQVVITGTSDSQWKAQYYIYEKIRQERFAPDENVKLRAEVQVPAPIVGRIIGKSGKNVRELQRNTGATIKLPEDSNPTQTNHVVVRIFATFNSSQLAQRRIQQLVMQSIRGSNYRIPNQGMIGGIQMQPIMNRQMNGNINRKNPRHQGSYNNNNPNNNNNVTSETSQQPAANTNVSNSSQSSNNGNNGASNQNNNNNNAANMSSSSSTTSNSSSHQQQQQQQPLQQNTPNTAVQQQ